MTPERVIIVLLVLYIGALWTEAWAKRNERKRKK